MAGAYPPPDLSRACRDIEFGETDFARYFPPDIDHEIEREAARATVSVPIDPPTSSLLIRAKRHSCPTCDLRVPPCFAQVRGIILRPGPQRDRTLGKRRIW